MRMRTDPIVPLENESIFVYTLHILTLMRRSFPIAALLFRGAEWGFFQLISLTAPRCVWRRGPLRLGFLENYISKTQPRLVYSTTTPYGGVGVGHVVPGLRKCKSFSKFWFRREQEGLLGGCGERKRVARAHLLQSVTPRAIFYGMITCASAVISHAYITVMHDEGRRGQLRPPSPAPPKFRGIHSTLDSCVCP